ncbi:MAG: glutamine--fructose-6-phosphate transaminase (isomerizing) [Clostridia bacterium]|nr:glutamine--fructose-6-phosphate transaminase (isomerizing) [Clostridia bacterium]
MCGIVGYAGAGEAGPLLLEGLGRLAYRGYDSAGVAVCGDDGRLSVIRAAGRLDRLREKTQDGAALHGSCGIGHTRWATHGAPDERNAHPHASPDGLTAIVHNGIIGNHLLLRSRLEAMGYVFRSETDTEAAALLLHACWLACGESDPRRRALAALRGMAAQLTGSYAICALFAGQPDAVYAVRRGSPLVIGCCDGGYMLASDVPALLGRAHHAVHLHDGEYACVSAEAVELYDADGCRISRESEALDIAPEAADKGGYAHYMLKEIVEQPQALRRTIGAYTGEAGGSLRADLQAAGLGRERLAAVRHVLLFGCGSAYHAGVAGRYAMERLARIPCRAELASELRSRELLLDQAGTLAVAVSQSGETADTLAALRLCRAHGVPVLAVVNAAHSTMAREADGVLLTRAGPEIAVATTKAYTAQAAVLDLLAIALAAARGCIGVREEASLLGALHALPDAVGDLLGVRDSIRRIAEGMAGAHSAFFIGRGIDHAAAMEGSLKLKEVSYIHAEAYPAGELKHGAISLIEPGVPVIGICTQTDTAARMQTAMAEAGSRGACLVHISSGECAVPGAQEIRLPQAHPLIAPVLAAVPLQLLAYEIGCLRGLDVDQPRNLAKSVTVE